MSYKTREINGYFVDVKDGMLHRFFYIYRYKNTIAPFAILELDTNFNEKDVWRHPGTFTLAFCDGIGSFNSYGDFDRFNKVIEELTEKWILDRNGKIMEDWNKLP